ncbi:hypothetical protein HDU85_004720 [Gaertneriomyces sp. JEL0708]|nr:hypothetical protein HDU85_004720 [Gaertneriomyces sp. JEL0708]
MSQQNQTPTEGEESHNTVLARPFFDINSILGGSPNSSTGWSSSPSTDASSLLGIKPFAKKGPHTANSVSKGPVPVLRAPTSTTKPKPFKPLFRGNPKAAINASKPGVPGTYSEQNSNAQAQDASLAESVTRPSPGGPATSMLTPSSAPIRPSVPSLRKAKSMVAMKPPGLNISSSPGTLTSREHSAHLQVLQTPVATPRDIPQPNSKLLAMPILSQKSRETGNRTAAPSNKREGSLLDTGRSQEGAEPNVLPIPPPSKRPRMDLGLDRPEEPIQASPTAPISNIDLVNNTRAPDSQATLHLETVQVVTANTENPARDSGDISFTPIVPSHEPVVRPSSIELGKTLPPLSPLSVPLAIPNASSRSLPTSAGAHIHPRSSQLQAAVKQRTYTETVENCDGLANLPALAPLSSGGGSNHMSVREGHYTTPAPPSLGPVNVNASEKNSERNASPMLNPLKARPNEMRENSTPDLGIQAHVRPGHSTYQEQYLSQPNNVNNDGHHAVQVSPITKVTAIIPAVSQTGHSIPNHSTKSQCDSLLATCKAAITESEQSTSEALQVLQKTTVQSLEASHDLDLIQFRLDGLRTDLATWRMKISELGMQVVAALGGVSSTGLNAMEDLVKESERKRRENDTAFNVTDVDKTASSVCDNSAAAIADISICTIEDNGLADDEQVVHDEKNISNAESDVLDLTEI